MKGKNLYEKIEYWASNNPEQKAIVSAGGFSFNYGTLKAEIDKIGGFIEQAGVKKGEVIALVMPNGIEMTISFLGVMSVASAAPLNPRYTENEFDFYIQDLKPRVVLVLEGENTEVNKVAKKYGIEVFCVKNIENEIRITKIEEDVSDLGCEPAVANAMAWQASCADAAASQEGNDEDVALILHTSGTTARPKIVPLSHENICASAMNTCRTFGLEVEDVCLNVMPMFHIHAIVCSVAVIMSGGTLICPSYFEELKFFGWMDEFEPSWYTASPTMHLAVLSQVKNNLKIVEKNKIRLIRSSSSPMSKEIIAELENVFGARVLESYGMTEAALQITSNQLEPGLRKPGSAGMADGPELKIVNELGEGVEQGVIGEVVIRGKSIFEKYRDNDEANRESFFGKWFRTGDLGYLDVDAYLFLSGRLKEMINKGGENISPREIDEAAMRNEKIKIAMAFSLPHKTLGQDVGLVVVLEEGNELSKEEVRNFLKNELVGFKIPQAIIFLDEIPKGPTGKPKRIGLYDKIKDKIFTEHREVNSEIGKSIKSIWKEVLGLSEIGMDDNFFEIGGDSLKLKQIQAKMKGKGYEVIVDDLFDCPSISQVVKLVNRQKK